MTRLSERVQSMLRMTMTDAADAADAAPGAFRLENADTWLTPPEHVTSGAGESLLNALLTLIDPGDRVLLTNPTYSGMAQRVRLAGGEQVFTSLVARDGRWTLDLDDVRERARGCRVLFFASPCMPVGTVFTERETAALVAAAQENDAWIVFNGHADKVAFDIWSDGQGKNEAWVMASDGLHSIDLATGKAGPAIKIDGVKGQVRDIAILPAM